MLQVNKQDLKKKTKKKTIIIITRDLARKETGSNRTWTDTPSAGLRHVRRKRTAATFTGTLQTVKKVATNHSRSVLARKEATSSSKITCGGKHAACHDTQLLRTPATLSSTRTLQGGILTPHNRGRGTRVKGHPGHQPTIRPTTTPSCRIQITLSKMTTGCSKLSENKKKHNNKEMSLNISSGAPSIVLL